MKTCCVNPSWGECHACGEVAEHFDGIPNCSECGRKKKRYELLKIVPGIIDDYAFVCADGKIQKVSLDRVFDIREEMEFREEKENV